MSGRLSLADAEDLAAGALRRSATGEAQARSVARALVAAEAAGQAGHGLRRLAAYAAQAKAGKVDGKATPTAERNRPAVLAVDAGHGFAFPALDLAVERLPVVAKEQGVALAAIRRSHHAGVMGLTVERFAEMGLVAIMFANTPAAMAPWGGKRALFGTNPIAFAAPLAGDAPVVIDLSLSKIARGKVMAAKQKGTTIPEGWALDQDGNPTSDPVAGLAGTMVPAGEAKGAALALMVEMLAAGLAGANYAYEASSLFDDRGPPPGLGQLIVAVDTAALGRQATTARLAELASLVEHEPGARLPGRRGRSARAEAAVRGIEIADDLLAEISAL